MNSERMTMRVQMLAIILTAGLAVCQAEIRAEITNERESTEATLEQPTPPGQSSQPIATAAARNAAAASAVDAMPIRKITLYRSGVGAFIRQGSIAGDSKVQLKFDISQINDVLKSLQVLDRSGGRVDSVTYGSKDPLSRRLASFALQVGDNPSIPQLLERLRGAKVTISTGDKTISGTVLSTENRKVVDSGGAGGGVAVDVPHVNILTGTGIRSVAIRNIGDFVIDDRQLADDLQRALSAMGESRAERVKAVDLTLSGTGDRDVVVGYIHETPVWKTSYRLVLPEAKIPAANAPADDKPAAPNPQGMLQGWAIVENTTDQDWSNVRLSLVSGRPVSFRMDLYEPLYAFRPEVPVPTVPGVSPRQYDGAVGQPQQPGSGASGAVGFNRGGGPSSAAAAPASVGAIPRKSKSGSADEAGAAKEMLFGDRGEVSSDDMLNYSPRSQASGQEVGEVFQFALDNPVTIERQRSAMIPILNAAVGGRRVSIYNASDSSKNPMRGVEIINTSDLQLLPGPIAVFDGAAYAGDAQIGQIPPGDKRLLAYAVDLEVNVTTTSANESNLMSLKISDGVLVQTYKQRQGLVYKLDNKDIKRPRTVLVEHGKMEGWTLLDIKPEQETQNLYRFGVNVPAGKTVELKVIQEHIDRQMIGIDSYDQPSLIRLRADGKISDAVLAALGKLMAKQSEINTNQRQIEDADAKLTSLRPDQTRVAGMMEKLDKTSDTYKNLLLKLNRQEGEIDTLVTSRGKLTERAEALRQEYSAMLRGLSVE